MNRLGGFLRGRHGEMLVIGPIHPECWDGDIVEIGRAVIVLVYHIGLRTGLDGASLMTIGIGQKTTPIDRDGKLKTIIHTHDRAGQRPKTHCSRATHALAAILKKNGIEL